MRKLLVAGIRTLEASDPDVRAFRHAYDFRSRFATPDERGSGPESLSRALERALAIYSSKTNAPNELPLLEVERGFLAELAAAVDLLPATVILNFVHDLRNEAVRLKNQRDLVPILKAAMAQYASLAAYSLSPGP